MCDCCDTIKPATSEPVSTNGPAPTRFAEMYGKARADSDDQRILRGLADYAAGVSGPAESFFDVDVSVSGTAAVEDLTDEQIEAIAKGAAANTAERLLRQREEARAVAAADEEEIDLDEMFPADLAAMLAHELVESKYYDADNLIAGLRRFIRDASTTAKG